MVAARLPAGRRDAAQRQSGAGRGRARAWRRRLGHHPARHHAAVAAVDPGAVDAGLHPRHRGVRGAGAGRPAGPHLGAHHRHLHQHGGARAARHRRRQRALGADARPRAGAALYLRPAVAPRRAVRHHHRQGLPAAAVRSRAAAPRRGRSARAQLRAAVACAHADAGLGVAVAVLPAGQRGRVQAHQPQQLPHRARLRADGASGQHAPGRGCDRHGRDDADLPGRLACGAARARRLARRAARHHSAGVSRPHSRHRGDAGVPAHSDPALWHARHSDLGLRHQLSALWHALLLLRHAADPPRARRSRRDLRRLAADAVAPDRGAAAWRRR